MECILIWQLMKYCSIIIATTHFYLEACLSCLANWYVTAAFQASSRPVFRVCRKSKAQTSWGCVNPVFNFLSIMVF